jgi:serine/threonine-protein phosphatase 2A activator
MANTKLPLQTLQVLDLRAEHEFSLPVKRINDGDDVTFFLASKAYTDIMTFIFQLNAAMFPQKLRDKEDKSYAVKEWKLQDTEVPFEVPVQNLRALLGALNGIIDEAPPDPGPRRFGNISFRKWYDLVRERVPGLLDQYLSKDILTLGLNGNVSAKVELEAYLIGSFGSSQRLDYGTGHELSFLAFLGCLWKLGAFAQTDEGEQERAIVLGVIEP